jgi:hypothetical protein
MDSRLAPIKRGNRMKSIASNIMKRIIWVLIILCAVPNGTKAETGLQLTLPIACTLGADCFIQQYTDVDSGPEARDYRCGTATYDGHKGTDFRVLSIEAAARGVPVLASAPGRVKAMRDGVEDRLIASRAEVAALEGRDCGNAVIIDHGGGWETQYCHMKRGSVRVRSGDAVEAGVQLGLVGYSGNAQFAHVHLTVRHDSKDIDPFSGKAQDGTCNAQDPQLSASLWAPQLRSSLTYTDAAVIEAGFAAGPVTPEDAERGAIALPGPQSPGFVFYARLINLRKDDSLRIMVKGPGDFELAKNAPLDRDKAQFVTFMGKKLTTERWAAGRYQGQIEVMRGDKIIGRHEATFDLP